MNLAYEFTLRFEVNMPAHEVGAGPFGRRIIYNARNGRIEGDRIKAECANEFGSTLITPDGRLGRFEAVTDFVTSDRSHLFLRFEGLLEINDKTQRAMEHGEGTEFRDQKLHMILRAECGDKKHEWVNDTLFVGEGRWLKNHGVEYKVYRLE